MSDPVLPRPRRPAVRWLVLALVVQLAVAVAALRTLAPAEPAPPLAQPAPTSPVNAAPAPDPAALRASAVRELLDARASALLARDRDAFLATVWKGSPAFVERQAELFDALAEVPLASWRYELDPATERGPDPALDATYGEGRWWAPDVVLTYALEGFDPEPTYAPQKLTFVRSGQTWQLAADDDFADQGLRSTRALWDAGPVVVDRGEHSLVLGHPGSERLMRQLADAVDAAVPRVTGVWGPWSEKVVVLVPDDAQELDAMLGGSTDLTRIAAVATAEVPDLGGEYRPVGNRVIVNPPNFAKLGRLGRQVVLTHEVAHVATRAASGPDMPTWLVEGLADYIGYLDVDVPLSTAARETRAAAREGRLPTALPADTDFDGGSARLPLTYEVSWLAFRLLVETYGLEPSLAFYRSVGSSRGAGAQVALERAFAAELATTPEAFTALWRDHLASTGSS